MTSPPERGGNKRDRKVTLVAAVLGGSIAAITELVPLLNTDPSAIVRALADGLIAIVALYQLMTTRRTEPVMALAAIVFGTLSLVEAAGMMDVAGFDTGSTLALLIVLAIVYVTTRQSRTAAPLVVGSTLIGVYVVASILIERPGFSATASRLLVGIVGQGLAIWLTSRLIDSLAVASELETTHSRIQQALARCSQVLLTHRDDEPLTAALEALLDATEADYAYIDMNRVDREGNVTWEIVADAMGSNVPPSDNLFDRGDYDQLQEVNQLLAAGKPAQVIASDLPRPIRDRYEAEGVKAELMAPIFIRGQWVGTIGYSDFWREGTWLPVEVEALTRAADMVGAYWEREHAREGLEELAEAKDRFIATVSHELRTPLAAVVGFAGELAENVEDYSPEEIAEMVQLIASQSLEMAQLVDDLLTAERAASGNLTIKPGAIDLLSESHSVVESMRVAVDVIVEGEPTPAWADTLRTRQILRNLLTNAARYGGSQVRISVSSLGDTAVMVVSDDGPGINVVDSERIFDPYYRAQTDEPRPDSVGLGLAVARQLARIMGGDLVYRRRAGWTRFELTLPTDSENAPALAFGA
ncbi:MAG TPA: HAMP domain-containing sensor histidine kinase [Acidimicrobiia bacterium]|nr:HAMP domain-containing sensor histidine kinase [Acidimicrobiia bacterium]